MNKGLTLVEVLVGVALFLVIAVSVYNGYSSIYNVVSAARVKVTAANLINEQFEIMRNLEYADVGIVNSVPAGVLAHEQTLVRDGITFGVTTTIRNVDDPFDGTIGGSPNDTSPADYKLAEVEVTCETCKNFLGMVVTSRIAPKNLETASTNGALFVRVLDANGQPISDADVHIENNTVNPAVVIDDVTNTQGMLQIVDVVPGINAYEITVTKDGYTTDQTYLPGDASNPNPLKPHATIAVQQVTQITFVIDLASTIKISTITPACTPVGSVDFLLEGSRLIGASPDVVKYSTSHVTNGSGKKTISDIEWDAYNITLTDSAYEFAGLNPQNPFNIIAGSTQDVDLIVVPKNQKSLLVSVKDAATQLPISDAMVELEFSGTTETQSTGQGFAMQTDWSGGSGQDSIGDPSRFYASDGDMETLLPVGELRLRSVFGEYVANGELESSTFDTGTTSNFNSILWQPTDQPPDTGADNVRFQIATNASSSDPWTFFGPDGTAGTYYTVLNQNINAIHSGDRYLRYKVLFNTASTTLTPNIAQVSFTYTSECIPPGQALFSNLNTGTHTLTVTKAGYETVQVTVPVVLDWQQTEITLFPEP